MIVQQIILITDSGKMRGLVNVIFFLPLPATSAKILYSFFSRVEVWRNPFILGEVESTEKKRKEKKYYVKRSTSSEGLWISYSTPTLIDFGVCTPKFEGLIPSVDFFIRFSLLCLRMSTIIVYYQQGSVRPSK